MDTVWEPSRQYDDEETFHLLSAVAFTLSLPMEDLLETYGVWFFNFAMEEGGWDKLLGSMANDLHEFLDNLSFTHFFMFQLTFTGKTIRVPKFRCDARPDGSLRLHYYSSRKGLPPLVKGLVKQAAKVLFGQEVKISVAEHNQERGKSLTAAGTAEGIYEHVVFAVESLTKGQSLCATLMQANRVAQSVSLGQTTTQTAANCESPALLSPTSAATGGPSASSTASAAASAALSKPLQMTVGFFAAMFPSHVCFNRQMVIEHCGEFLFNELDMAKKRTSKVTDLFTMLQPDDVPLNFKSIVTYLNSVYILRLKMPIKRNTTAVHNGGGVKGRGNGGSTAIQQTRVFDQHSFLAFKGQMVLVNNGNSLLYMCSPHVNTVRGLVEANLYISDLQRHDTTRDLIMLNQSRISQQELK